MDARMTAPDVTSLRELAEAARDSQPPSWDDEQQIEIPARWYDPDAMSSRNMMSEADSRYLAAANPTAVLALLDENARLRAAVERVEALADSWDWWDDYAQRNFGEKTHGPQYATALRAALDGEPR